MKWAAGLALAVLLALPAVLSGYAVTIFILIFFYAFLAQAWNIVGGYAGQLSAGHAAFVGIGGYTAALLFDKGVTPWIGMFAGGALAAVLGAIIGYLGFRFGLRGFYFVLLTVAFAEVCRILVSNIDALGGWAGYFGLRQVFTPKVRGNLFYSRSQWDNNVAWTGLGVHRMDLAGDAPSSRAPTAS